MQFSSAEIFQRDDGRHLASEPHLRVQILTLDYQAAPQFFDGYHGELLIQIHDGAALLSTRNAERRMEVGDQALLVDGEAFMLNPVEEGKTVRAQYIWAPGPNPCKTCWETSGRFFDVRKTT